MNNHIIVIGTSAGGLEALKNIFFHLPKDLSAPILIVKHIPPHAASYLPSVLSHHSDLPFITPYHGQSLEIGQVYIAPSNLHMTVERGKILLQHGPKVNHSRPAIDPLFYSAAAYYGSCAIGILLSGLLDDGSAGLLAIKRNKGITIIQDLEEAQYPDMPRNAAKTVPIDYCLTANHIAKQLIQLVKRPIPEAGCTTKSPLINQEIKMNKTENSIPDEEMNKIGSPSVFACPECNGVLWEIEDGNLLRYRCRVGHAYGLEGLSEFLAEEVEDALWAALRALEEKESLAKRIANKAAADDGEAASHFNQKVKLLKKQVQTLRSLLSES